VTNYKLNPDLDVASLAREFAAIGRVRVNNLLEQDAVIELYDYLDQNEGWWQLINMPDGIIELDRAKRAAMSAEEHARLEADVHDQARFGFQYRYEGLRVPAQGEEGFSEDDPLTAFGHLMCSEKMLEFLRAVTGSSEVAFTDGQATAYGPGDFLTGHDDDVPGKDRIAAYVFGLTPRWRPEWGGLLLFHGPKDATVAGNVPRFNVLDLFAVPQRHSVSIVTPAAPMRRYAVTGWLRSRSE
jgi:Rps23 Pro-64 3,4-dihydroxylase Tpa1-like proline 4-hydroxylase